MGKDMANNMTKDTRQTICTWQYLTRKNIVSKKISAECEQTHGNLLLSACC
jgi:hypothetical protein